MSARAKEILTFGLCTAAIYTCHIISGLIHEKIFKAPYYNTITKKFDYYTLVLPLIFIPALTSACIGYFMVEREQLNNQNIQALNNRGHIPRTRIFTAAGLDFVGHALSNVVVMLASYVAVTMVHTCGLLSVILVSVFCSGVTDRSMRVGKQKILIGLIVCSGIVIFNVYTPKDQQNSKNHPLTLLTSVMLAVSLLLEGFRTDQIAQIKLQYHPSHLQLYFQMYKSISILCFIALVCTLQLFDFLSFVWQHDSFMLDIFSLGLLSAIGDITIYKMIKNYKQHVVPFVVIVRKFLTLIVNTIVFRHPMVVLQGVGMLIVFLGVFWQLYMGLTNGSNTNQSTPNVPEMPKKISQNQEFQTTNTDAI